MRRDCRLSGLHLILDDLKRDVRHRTSASSLPFGVRSANYSHCSLTRKMTRQKRVIFCWPNAFSCNAAENAMEENMAGFRQKDIG